MLRVPGKAIASAPVNSAYATAVSFFYQLANLFFWPVAIALIVLFALALADLGRLLYQAFRRRREPGTDLVGLANRIQTSARAGLAPSLDGVSLSASLRRFWTDVDDRMAALPPEAPLDLWLEEALQRREIVVTSSLDRSRALVRIGPMLGLAGTIIPLGPALQALLSGDVTGMVSHLVVGFGAVVCGLVLSGVAYAITLVRERWARVDMKEMENLCELLMRTQAAPVQPPPRELEYARV